MLSFDPLQFSAGNLCVDFLRDKGLTISQKLGARLLVLAANNLQLTLAALEDATPKSAHEKFLLTLPIPIGGFLGGESEIKKQIASCLQELPYNVMTEDGIVKLLSFYEAPTHSELQLATLANPLSEAMLPKSASQVGILSDRRYIEELTLSYLDSKKESVSVESFRKLVRIAVMSGNDPTSLLTDAIKRGDPIMIRESASLIAELIDPVLGKGLSALFASENESELILILKSLPSSESSFSKRILAASYSFFLQKFRSLRSLLETSNSAFNIFKELPEPFFNYISYTISLINELNGLDLKYFRLFVKDFAPYFDFFSFFKEEYLAVTSDEKRVAIIWFTSIFERFPESVRYFYLHEISSMIVKGFANPATSEMLKTAMLYFRPEILFELSRIASSKLYEQLTETVRFTILEFLDSIFLQDGISEILPILQILIKKELEQQEPSILKKLFLTHFIHSTESVEIARNSVSNTLLLVQLIFELYSSVNQSQQKKFATLASQILPDSVGLYLSFLKSESVPVAGEQLQFLSALYLASPVPSLRPEIISYIRNSAKSEILPASILARLQLLEPDELDSELCMALLDELEQSSGLRDELYFRALFSLYPFLPEESQHEVTEQILSLFEPGEQNLYDYILPELILFYRTKKSLFSTDQLLRKMMRLNALKLTLPSISQRMKLEDVGSSFSKVYNSSSWGREELSQSLYFAITILDLKLESCKKEATDLILYLFRHWQSDSVGFILSDRIIVNAALTLDKIGSDISEELFGAICEKLLKQPIELLWSEDLAEYLLLNRGKGLFAYKKLVFNLKEYLNAQSNLESAQERFLSEIEK